MVSRRVVQGYLPGADSAGPGTGVVWKSVSSQRASVIRALK